MSQWEDLLIHFSIDLLSFNIFQYFQGYLDNLELSILIVIFGILLGCILAGECTKFVLFLCIIVFADIFRALPHCFNTYSFRFTQCRNFLSSFLVFL